MSKYRLSYKKNNNYVSIDLNKLDFFKNKKDTDIKTIDEFTTKFNNLEELLEYLKNNKLIENNVNKLFITIDKKYNNSTILKKIYNGDKLLFSKDIEYLNISNIYRWIMFNKNNYEYMIKIADNYLEKYKNTYNKETKSSSIIAVFNNLKNISRLLKENKGYISKEIFFEFESSVEDFINFEFYKIDRDIFLKENKIEIKKDANGLRMKSYRNIHDFVLLIKELDKTLINDIEPYFEEEEYLTKEDFIRSDNELLKNYGTEKFDSFQDGNDYITYLNKKELKSSLNSISKKLILPKSDSEK